MFYKHNAALQLVKQLDIGSRKTRNLRFHSFARMLELSKIEDFIIRHFMNLTNLTNFQLIFVYLNIRPIEGV
jgi:hypothetical protein